MANDNSKNGNSGKIVTLNITDEQEEKINEIGQSLGYVTSNNTVNRHQTISNMINIFHNIYKKHRDLIAQNLYL